MFSKIHAGLTALLMIGIVALAGLAYSGRVHIGKPAGIPERCGEKAGEMPAEAGGRYRIDSVEEARVLFEGAGKQGFLGTTLLEAWVFKYTGGYLQVHLETDLDGKTDSGDELPSAEHWPTLLSLDEGIRENRSASYRKQGYVILAAMPSVVSVQEAAANYHFQLTGILACGHLGPLHLLPSLSMEVSHKRPYRLYLSADPIPGTGGAGFAPIWAEYLLPTREPILPRRLTEEEFHVPLVRNLQAGKSITLLDRKRGNGRIRLQARFLGDGEIRELAGKAKN